jgi:glycosyltransferase involved in cell wall biosynthesis
MVTTYNHEKYIHEAVASALGQTLNDLEVVIVDDGSTDRTGDIIRSFTDPRVRYVRQPNQGSSVAANNAMAACRGKYLAMLSGDDVLHPERLDKQLRACERGPTRLIFSATEFIDDDGNSLPPSVCPEIFEDSNVTRAQFLERFFFAPCCTSPRWSGITAFGELHVFRSTGPADPALLQVNDFLRWLQLVKKYDFEILPEPLYKLRIRTSYENLSGPAPGKQLRLINEMFLVMRSFFDDLPTELFREAFRRHLVHPDFSSETERACEEAFLYFHSTRHLISLLGMERLYQLLHDPAAALVLKQQYDFDSLRFAEALTRLDIRNLFVDAASVVAVEQDKGWRPEDIVRQPINPYYPHFRVVFDLERFAAPRTVAWIPFEHLRLGRVKVERFRYLDASGTVHDHDPRNLPRHACSLVDDYFVFELPEARLYFSPPGPVKQLEVAGQLELLTPSETCARLTAAVKDRQSALEQVQRRLVERIAPPSLWSSLRTRARQGARRVRTFFSD